MKFILYAVLLTHTYFKVNAIQCEQCSTLEAKTCRDPYNTDNLGDCDDDNSYCVKYKTIVKIRDSGYINGWERDSHVVTRTCEPKAGKKEGCIGWQNNGGITIKCWCGTDGCNSAPYGSQVGIGLLLSSFLLSAFLLWR